MIAANSPEISLCKFKDGKPAAVTLTFDDGSKDHLYQAAPLLKKYGYKGTFYIIVKRVPAAKNSYKLSWPEIKQLAKDGHEIGNHSMTHFQLFKAKSRKNLEYEIITPIAIIKEKVGVKPETFCYPGNAKTPEIVKLVESAHAGSTKGRRFFYGGDNFDLVKQQKWLDDAITNRSEHQAMIHGIVPGGGGWKPFKNIAVFEEVLKNIKKHDNQLWVCTFAELCKYKKVRDAAKITVTGDKGSTIFDVSSKYRFGIPLTVKISPCPAAVSAEQQGRSLSLIRRGDSGYIDVVPERGQVVLKGL